MNETKRCFLLIFFSPNGPVRLSSLSFAEYRPWLKTVELEGHGGYGN